MRNFRAILPTALLTAALIFPSAASAQIYVSLFAPPLMPSYTMPVATVPNSIWTPGYWAYGPYGYYWVPGTYVTPPSLGLYWTPGYWGVNPYGGGYSWNQGYWGPQVGYYGGINYGGGYFGTGFVGGNWVGNAFSYNTAVTPVNPTVIRNVYVNKTVVVRNVTVNRYSYNGPGGVRMHPDAAQQAIMREHHVEMTPVQRAHVQEAQQDRNLLAKVNGGKPSETVAAHPLSATNRPPDFKPVTAADKTTAHGTNAAPSHQMAPSHQNAAPSHAAPSHAAPSHAAPTHAQPAPAHAQPAPQHMQTQHTQTQHTQTQHTQTQHMQQGKPPAGQPAHQQAATKEKPTHPPTSL